MSSKEWLTPEEKEYIKQNYESMTVKEMAINLKRNNANIYNYITNKLRKSIYKVQKIQERLERPVELKNERPAPVYTNSKSPYGIADELMMELAYLNPQMSKRIL